MFEKQFVGFTPSEGSLWLNDAVILIDENDLPGVQIAARSLSEDFGRVTKKPPIALEKISSKNTTIRSMSRTAIILGSIESSYLLKKLENDKVISYPGIRGKWESYLTSVVDKPLSNIDRALVIAGSDKRGAIFGIYTLSEQLGVSPWYWWSDVPPKFHPNIYALPVRTANGEPTIRYRGIFINDEAPALTGWVLEKYGVYGVEFYTKVFELLLRLKANFMWPAMWPGWPNPGAVFFLDDDGKNQKLAEEYGIVVSTSHHEPMQRATTEWFLEGNRDGSWDWIRNKEKIVDFFEKGAERAKGCETYFTMGMRGEYDRKMSGDDPAAVVQDVLVSQRNIFKEVYGSEDGAPQLLALYKEVLGQFETGRINVPDDITLLFADDNHGTIRRLPTAQESKRRGGAGIYYHFEYVGIPRSYKWINSNSLGKTWHQLREAHRRHARQIWVFNVGDIKPVEVPLSFALSMAWDINSVKPDHFAHFYETMAEREFGDLNHLGDPRHGMAAEIAKAWHDYDRLASLRKHEMIEADTFSLLHHDEAEKILKRWEEASDAAQRIHNRAPDNHKPAVFELVLHPAKASYIYVALRVAQAKNKLYARQRRNSANAFANRVLELFDQDFDLQDEYHSLLNGRWNHMLRQTHYGYEETWHAPSRDMISGLCYVQRRQNSNPIVGQMGVMVQDHEGVRPGRINEESERTHPSRRDLVPGVTFRTVTRYDTAGKTWFEIFTRGKSTIQWMASSPVEWVNLSQAKGRLDPSDGIGSDARVYVTIDWDSVPASFIQEILIDVRSEAGDVEQLHLPVNGRWADNALDTAFIESQGYISISAPATSAALALGYQHLPCTGRELAGAVALNYDAADAIATELADSLPWLSYDVYTFTSTSTTKVQLLFTTTLEVDPVNPMSYDIQVDQGDIQKHELLQKQDQNENVLKYNLAESAQIEGWWDASQDLVWKRYHEWNEQTLEPGLHTIKVRLGHSNLILEKLILDLGGVPESYLGPPESFRVWQS